MSALVGSGVGPGSVGLPAKGIPGQFIQEQLETALQGLRGPRRWLEESALLSKVQELSRQTTCANWDGERGEPIGPQQWEEVRRLVSLAFRSLPTVPSPFVSACGDGTAHIQWTTPGGDRGVIEVGSGSSNWSFIPMSDEAEDEVVWLEDPAQGLSKVQNLFRLG